MREDIWKKEDFFDFINGPKYAMEADAVQFGQEVPVIPNFNGNAKPIGTVTDLRVEDGTLSGELRFYDEEAIDWENLKKSVRLGGYYKGVEYNDDKTVVTKCILMAVSPMALSYTPGWPTAGQNPGASIE